MMKKFPVQSCKQKIDETRLLTHLHDDHTQEELAITSCLLKSKWDLAAYCIKIGDQL